MYVSGGLVKLQHSLLFLLSAVVAGVVFSSCGQSQAVFRAGTAKALPYEWKTATSLFSNTTDIATGLAYGDFKLVQASTTASLAVSTYSAATYTPRARAYIPYTLGGEGWQASEGIGSAGDIKNVAAAFSSTGSLMAAFIDDTNEVSAAFKLSVSWGAAAAIALVAADSANNYAPFGLSSSVAWGLSGSSYFGYVSTSSVPSIIKHDGTSWGTAVTFPGTARSIQVLNEGISNTFVWQGDAPFKALSIGTNYDHNCAVDINNLAKCWGFGEDGRIGDDAVADREIPTSVYGLSGNVVMIDSSYGHSCAVLSTGEVKCWGINDFGQLGDGSTTDSDIPVSVSGISNAVKVAVGYYHSCALLNTGGLKCWGSNSDGQVGDGTWDVSFSTPVDVSGLSSGVSAVTAGVYHTCALTTSGGVKCWGDGTGGSNRLGNGEDLDYNAPDDVSGLSSGVYSIDAGANHTCAVISGAMKCWGHNGSGQLGNGTVVTASIPDDVSDLSGVVAVSAGASHTCAALQTGLVKCWGLNGTGQLGDGTTDDSLVPGFVSGFDDTSTLSVPAVSIVAGSGHTCVRLSDSTIKCWGDNAHGQIGDNSTTQRLTPVNSLVSAEGDAVIQAVSWAAVGNTYSSLNSSSIKLISNTSTNLSDTETVAFDAASDSSGNSVVAFYQERYPSPECSIETTPVTDACAVRLYASVKNASGNWAGPTQIDGGVLTAETSSFKQGALIGLDYSLPTVAYIGDSKFLLAFSAIDTSARTNSIYLATYTVGKGWGSTPDVLETSLLLGTTEQYRVYNDLKLVSNGDGKAALVAHYASTNAADVADRRFGYRIFLYSTEEGWETPYAIPGLTACLATENQCQAPRPTGAVFSTGEAMFVLPAPFDGCAAGNCGIGLYELEYR